MYHTALVTKHRKLGEAGMGKMAEWLKRCRTQALSLVPTWQLTRGLQLQFADLTPSFGFCGHQSCVWYTHLHAGTIVMHIIK